MRHAARFNTTDRARSGKIYKKKWPCRPKGLDISWNWSIYEIKNRNIEQEKGSQVITMLTALGTFEYLS